MKSLVTGGCGFIGSNLVDQLVKLKHEVIVIDNHSSDAHFFNKLYPFINESVEYHKLMFVIIIIQDLCMMELIMYFTSRQR